MQINVLLENGKFMYSVGPNNPPRYTNFTHHFNVSDQITWKYWQSNQRVIVTFETSKTDICPFARPDNTPWPDRTATFPGDAGKLHPNFDMGRKYSRIPYSVTLPDSPGTPKDDPEVIIVNG